MKNSVALQQCHRQCQQGLLYHMIQLTWNFLLLQYITTMFRIFFSMDAEGKHRYFMLGDNSLFQAQNLLLQTTVHYHSNEPHTIGEKYPEKKFFFPLFHSATYFFSPSTVIISRQIFGHWTLWDAGVSYLFFFVHNCSALQLWQQRGL